MFQIGDLVQVKTRLKNDADNRQLVGIVESVVDGKVGVRYLNTNDFGFHIYSGITVYTNPLDYLRKIDSIVEKVK
jgi:hypothetical protein